jgi:hypothetical protein
MIGSIAVSAEVRWGVPEPVNRIKIVPEMGGRSKD